MVYKVGDRVTLSCDVPVRHPKAILRVMLEKGERGTVVRAGACELYVVRFDSCGFDVIIAREQMVHAVDELAAMRARLETQRIEMIRAYKRHGEETAVLRAQLAARDAALDEVLAFSNYGDVEQLKAMLATKHGVHPK